MLRSSHTVSF